MVNQSQLDAVQKLVQTSDHLSSQERDEWLSLLPFMNDKQLSELSTILQTPVPEKNQPVVPKVAPALPEAPSELDLPAPSAVGPTPPKPETVTPVTAQAPSVTKSQSSATSVSDFINRNFAEALHRTPPAKPLATSPGAPEAPVMPAPISPPGVAVPFAVKKEPSVGEVVRPVQEAPVPVAARSVADEPAQSIFSSADAPGVEVSKDVPLPETAPEEVIATPKNLEDVRRLNTATLRGRGALTIENELRVLCKKFGYFSILFALEHSPLYQTYTAVGARVLKDGQSFERAQESLAKSGRPYLTKPEFEEVNDLLQHIKSA